jgi:FkbM family methyltransferase
VQTVTLSELLEPLGNVDLIDIDIQGAELEVLAEAAPSLGRHAASRWRRTPA